MKTDEIIILSENALKEIIAREPRFKQVVKGYNGEIASVDICDKPMLVPHIPKLIDKVLFAWAGVVFGHRGNTPEERVINAEISKCLAGKTYSVKKLADVAEKLPNWGTFHDYETAHKIRL